MSIIIIDGAKLRKIKQIEKFLEGSTNKVVSSNPATNIQTLSGSQAEKVNVLSQSSDVLSNVVDTFKNEPISVETLVVDTQKNIAEHKIIPVQKIFDKK